MLSDIENRFPLLEIDYFEATAPDLLTALRQQQVDFCLLLTSNIQRDSDLEVETIIRSLRQLWIAPGHALLSQSVIHLRDIEKLPFLMLDTDQYPTVITQVWQHAGYQPSIHFRSNSFEAVRGLVAQGKLAANPLRDHVAAISVGIYQGVPVLDLDYPEDSGCDTDMNVVMTGRGGLVEVQGTAEGEPFSRAEMNGLLDLAEAGIARLVAAQKEALGA